MLMPFRGSIRTLIVSAVALLATAAMVAVVVDWLTIPAGLPRPKSREFGPRLISTDCVL